MKRKKRYRERYQRSHGRHLFVQVGNQEKETLPRTMSTKSWETSLHSSDVNEVKEDIFFFILLRNEEKETLPRVMSWEKFRHSGGKRTNYSFV